MHYDVQKIINTCPQIKKVLYLRICDSTNQTARELAEDAEPEFSLVLTDRQIAGRGRMGRCWLHDAEDGIAMSLLLRPKMPTTALPMMTLAAALAVHSALDTVAGIRAEIKWPNDILYQGKKICGILTEGVIDGENTYAVLGIGMNVNQTEIPDELSDTAVSLRMITGKTFLREELIAGIVNAFSGYYGIIQRDGDLRNLYEKYNQFCLKNSRINEKGEQIT